MAGRFTPRTGSADRGRLCLDMGGAFRKDWKRLFALSASMVFDRHRLVTNSGDLALLKFPCHSRFPGCLDCGFRRNDGLCVQALRWS